MISLAVAGGAAVFGFAFFVRDGIRVAVDPVGLPFGGLAMAGVFLLIAVMGAAASALARGLTHQRAILERAA